MTSAPQAESIAKSRRAGLKAIALVARRKPARPLVKARASAAISDACGIARF
jgi:hypothetical protein